MAFFFPLHPNPRTYSDLIDKSVTKLGRRLYIYIPLRAGYIQSKELASIRAVGDLAGSWLAKGKKTPELSSDVFRPLRRELFAGKSRPPAATPGLVTASNSLAPRIRVS
ncbi:predicted protein [Histoplasma capsulatum H143]|uniref:Uncharacterized protein n=1 Tax=Ajellomyces capsulatus (strain H143) TaxID=544712 RepID=C6HMD5_AJECH|nr:predicted protein [Histoplasma capsulatum H143]